MLFIDTVFPTFVFISSAVMMALGFCLLFLMVPKNPALTNYRISRKILALSYFTLAFSNAFALFNDSNLDNAKIISYVTLIAGAFQAFLFTYTIITLINTNFAKAKCVFCETLIILIFSIPLILFAVLGWTTAEKIAYFLLCAYYISMLVRYTVLFFRQERRYRAQIDNFFSNAEDERLKWVRLAFLGALAIGVMAFFAQLFPGSLFTRIFVALYIVFYFFFAIRYINYVQVFQIIEPVIADEPPKEKILLQTNQEEQLSQKIDDWVEKKQFLSTEITIQELALELRTNRTYLSNFINAHKQMNFKTWINQLRIEEARILLTQYPELSIRDITEKVGYGELSNFSRQFKVITGLTPSQWRKENT